MSFVKLCVCFFNVILKYWHDGVSILQNFRLSKYSLVLGIEITAKNGKKNTADFSENRKNHGKDTASNHGLKHHCTVYKIQHPALSTIITCSARFSL